ncbi:gephyrin-like molybdotransferase Glp [Candidatus Hecatella orcuttiae]|jgi:molybdopterin molybdotransferase|uniref:molybdopterin molybdotransferase MoeA n=1 Tax=Candidatus Hecatella orcuttiae TaxID=1935119 RepID=UPI002867B8D8|nr:gephyrin-like molybdotransferase Glp [Candidatus Hecatella orcuttiae]
METLSTPRRTDLKRTLKLKTLQEALQTLLAQVKIRPLAEMVPVEEAVGRVLAEDVVSPLNIPRYTMTFMDGYALRSEDTAQAVPEKPVALRVVGEVFPADFPISTKVSSHQAVYVACGGPVPEGADAVVKVEEVTPDDGCIKVSRPVRVGENIASAGEEVKEGSVILRKGQILRPQDMALLMGVRKESVRVWRKPKLALISVGDELVEAGKADPTKTVNNYASLIAGLALEAGAEPLKAELVPDDAVLIEAKLKEAISKAEIVATIGGCSVGVKDLVPDAVNALGSPGVIVHGVAVKPGHVAGAGVVDGKPVIMLPGHVVSATMAFYLFIAPLINWHLGLGSRGLLPTVKATLNREVKSKTGSLFLRVSIKNGGDGFVAEPVHGGSNVLATLVKANGFAFLPPMETLREGDELEITLFSKHEYAHLGLQ